MNFANRTIWTADNMEILPGIDSECVDLVYLDPPFNSNRNYAAPVGSKAAGAAFKDTWTLSDLDVAAMGRLADTHPGVYAVIEAAGLVHGSGMKSYLVMMADRLVELHRILKPTGSIYLHCDPTANSYLRLVLDGIFKRSNFRNEVIWDYSFRLMNLTRFFNRKHDVILFYAKSRTNRFLMPKTPWTRDEIIKTRKQKIHLDEEGNEVIWMPGGRGNSKSKLKKISDIIEEGKSISDVWQMPIISSSSKERLGYPTQKPLTLLERIITASSNEGDVVLDPFCGCATTLIAAEKLGRRWAGIDISPKAVELVRHRMIQTDLDLRDRTLSVHTTAPVRSDGTKMPRRQIKHTLYGQQEGNCNGCNEHFAFHMLEIDHVWPRSKGGPDTLENSQLLCRHCNSLKGTGTMDDLAVKLTAWQQRS